MGRRVRAEHPTAVRARPRESALDRLHRRDRRARGPARRHRDAAQLGEPAAVRDRRRQRPTWRLRDRRDQPTRSARPGVAARRPPLAHDRARPARRGRAPRDPAAAHGADADGRGRPRGARAADRRLLAGRPEVARAGGRAGGDDALRLAGRAGVGHPGGLRGGPAPAAARRSGRVLRLAVPEPEGLVYREELVSEDEERKLLDELERVDFDEIRMHGVVAKRTAKHYGLDYDYERRATVDAAEPVPEWLEPGREGAAELAGGSPGEDREGVGPRLPAG